MTIIRYSPPQNGEPQTVPVNAEAGSAFAEIAHDLSNVISIFSIAALYLRSEASSPEKQRCVDWMERAVAQGTTLCHQIQQLGSGLNGVGDVCRDPHAGHDPCV